ncbi:facilitated trehalose transporter Tret1-like [Diabrotica virgifera virgifera]|uniref:Facilitated trehalose transporter Tret1-like n=1 Tax=Diabrotica virgifera virgifera TaxID=50390 RepID=A0A6P7F128_DIAVI|nr:facilitated trehalose transporter Tret1-like [Diabrotica virgifera virgifera]
METNLLNGRKIEKEKSWPQVLAILIGAISGFCVGLLFAWSSPFLIKITQDKTNYNITEDEASYFNVIQPVSMIFSCPIFSTLTDIIGRKRTLLLIIIPHICSWLCSGFAKSVYVFYLSRVCAGFADGCIFASLPTYVGEVANPSVRGTWGNAVSFSLYFGEFMITVIGSYVSVRKASYIGIPICLLFFSLFSFMPESPYFYIKKGQEDDAKKSLRFLKGKSDVEEDYICLKKDVERQLSESASWIDIVKIRSNRKAILAGIFIRFTQQTAGLNVFYIYTQFIFRQGGGNISHEHASMLLLGVSLILNIIALTFIVKRFGRRGCYLWSLIGTGILLYIMGIYYYLKDNTTLNLLSFKWMPIATMMGYQVFASFGIATIPTLMLSELFSASVKSKAMAILTMTFGLGNFLNNFIFYELNRRIGFYAPFFFFAICNTIAAVMCLFVVPETKGKTLEEIQQELKGSRIVKK